MMIGHDQLFGLYVQTRLTTAQLARRLQNLCVLEKINALMLFWFVFWS